MGFFSEYILYTPFLFMQKERKVKKLKEQGQNLYLKNLFLVQKLIAPSRLTGRL